MRVETVVNTLLKFASENNHQITHLKLQKLLYFLYGEYLARTGKLLIEEHFEAWQYGPVIPKFMTIIKILAEILLVKITTHQSILKPKKKSFLLLMMQI